MMLSKLITLFVFPYAQGPSHVPPTCQLLHVVIFKSYGYFSHSYPSLRQCISLQALAYNCVHAAQYSVTKQLCLCPEKKVFNLE